ncbi:TIGR04222 domain-containing membrane protein, partial [Tahibacter caeni]|uniref:TIGR04222 domain-containing membrane protein n=1 Tax=Tahibacter caeni TaxID=1453545 RepID=UPI002147D548
VGPPPADYWPDARAQTASPARWRRVDLARGWLLPKPALPRPNRAQLLAATLLLGIAPLLQALPTNPLDYDGPTFLLLYFVLIAACIGIVVLVRRRFRGDSDAVPRGPALDTWAVAYLAGGTLRVVDAGVASLLADKQAQWDARKRRLQVPRPQDVRDYPLDEIARAAAADPALPRIVRHVRPRLQRLRDLLCSRGLLLTEGQRWSIGLASALPFALLELLGLAKIAVGIERDRPVGFLLVLTLLVGIATAMLLFRRPERTRAGDSLLAELNRRHAHARRAPRDGDIGLAVALAGTTVLAGTAYAEFHESRAANASSSGCSSGSSCSSDSGSSCSSGCGGCGGGGD